MADISKTVAIIFEGEDKTSGALASVERSLGGINTGAKEAAGGLNDMEDSAGKLGGSSSKIEGLATAIKGLAIAAVVKEFIDANVAAEQFRLSMEATTGSSAAAAKEFDYIRDVSNRLGLELVSTGEAYAKFAASAKGTSIDTAEAKVIFEAISGTMSRLGASAVDVSGALVQLSQGVGKNRFELEDLKSIADRIPGFFSKFSEALGVNTDQLYKMISAGQIGGDEILKLSEKLNQGLAGVNFDGFVASSNRFRNAITEAYIDLGNAGAFDVLKKGVEAGTAAIVGAIAGFKLLGEIAANVAFTIASGDFAGFGARFDDSMSKAADTTRKASDALLGVKATVTDAGDAGEKAGGQITTGFEKAALSVGDMQKAAKEVDAALKAIGIDPGSFVDPIDAVSKAFADLANNPAVTGDQFLSGFLVTLDTISSSGHLDDLRFQLEDAFQRGTIGADKYGVAISALDQKQSGVWDGMIRTTKTASDVADAHEKQAKKAEAAEQATAKLALELEKLASNERIKLIEAKVQIDVARLQADTEIVKAAFASIDTTIESTGDLLGTLFGQLDSNGNSFRDQWKIEEQIDLENERRDKALELQKALTEAQIREMEARTRALEGGDALIKIDGAGLKPHLEAFMWEILRTIQTRVNRDGLRMLVGI